MTNTKAFIREHKEIVMLVCDYYETRHIPREMTDVKKNLSLFPVANIPMIEYILASLCEQGFYNVILAGKNCEEVAAHVGNNVGLAERMNIMALKCDGKSTGDLMRLIDDNEFEFDNLLVLHGNHYTNYPLRNVLDKHREHKNAVMTLLLHPNESNSKAFHLYGFKDDEVVLYDRCVGDKYDTKKMADAIERHQTLELSANLSSPTIAAVSSRIFPLFTENFDFSTFGNLIEGLLAFNAYNLKILCCRQQDGDVASGLGSLSIKQGPGFYSREIITLCDYFRFNEDVRNGKVVDLLKFKAHGSEALRGFARVDSNIFFDSVGVEVYEPISNTVVGFDLKFRKECSIRDSVVGHGCFIEGNIDRCIVWDDAVVQQDLIDHIIFSNGGIFHCNHLETETEEAELAMRKHASFFDDFLAYLWSLVNSTEDLYAIDMTEVAKEVSLLRIIWNASDSDLMEVFSIFLADMIDPDDIEGSTISASLFFPILCGHTNGAEEQEALMEHLLQSLNKWKHGIKKDVFGRYGYLLIEDGIISRSVFKRYNKKLKI
jgi:translation initiation factor eIF-2B subunit epsilon